MSYQNPLLLVLARLLKPNVRILPRHTIAYEDFVEVARRAFVTVAGQAVPPEGRKQSLTEIALDTGICRHEVKEMKSSVQQEDSQDAMQWTVEEVPPEVKRMADVSVYRKLQQQKYKR